MSGSKVMYWIGWGISGLAIAALTMSATMKFVKPPDLEKGFEHLGWDLSLALALGIVEISCVLVYALPQTSVLGAILLTGYLGGAIATHVRIGDPFYVPVILGVLVWLGLFLRDARLRAILPLRS